MIVFALAALAGVLFHGLWNLYDIARRPLPQREPAASDPVAALLEARVRKLSIEIGRRNDRHSHALELAADFIRGEFKAAGYEVIEQTYSVRPPGEAADVTMRNLIATLPAATPDAPVLVIGAHYDTAPDTPGADDNASGIAALIELSRDLKSVRGDVELRFIAFGTEEPPYFGSSDMGSAVAARALKGEGRKVAGMISLEMLGYYNDAAGSQKYPPLFSLFYTNRANFIAFVSNLNSRHFLADLAKGYAPPHNAPMIQASLPEWIGEVGLSDHKNFWNEGFPAIVITDTAFLRYAHYHGPTDTPEKLDYVKMADVTRGIEATLRAYVAGTRGKFGPDRELDHARR